MTLLDLRKLYKELESCVLEDVKENGKPALIYNYLHHNQAINALDLQEQWEKERKNFESKNWSKKCTRKEIKIGNYKHDCIIWIFQPLNTKGELDTEKYNKAGGLPIDPLAASVGYMITAMCYIQFVKLIE